MRYQLHYWPGIPGRGEFVRLALEAAGAPYEDVARAPGGEGMTAMAHYLEDGDVPRPPFACPFLVDGERVIGQTAAILLYLGPRLKLVGRNEADRLWTHQLQLTIADLVSEVHATHHPISGELYFEDQRTEAMRAAAHFRAARLPKFLAWFESVLARNPRNAGGLGPHLVGGRLSYADLSLFQLVEGLAYAFPQATQRALSLAPRVTALRTAVTRQPRVAAYLVSARRLPFNEEGIFRHYPELDG